MRLIFMLTSLFMFNLSAEEVIWKGELDSNGKALGPINLNRHEPYQIRVSGVVNLGKWVQAGEKLANDACFEFNHEKELTKHLSVRNSHDINVCDGTYHKDHIYTSEPFMAKTNRILFWVDDTDYEDNYGSFHIEIIRNEKK